MIEDNILSEQKKRKRWNLVELQCNMIRIAEQAEHQQWGKRHVEEPKCAWL